MSRLLVIFMVVVTVVQGQSDDSSKTVTPIPARVKVLQIVNPKNVYRNYPYGLTTLLKHLRENTAVAIDDHPDTATSFEDNRIFDYPFIYVNFADRREWKFSELEKRNLRAYLARGGFIHVDAGIRASFLRGHARAAQRHSFADWEETPEIRDAFKDVFPGKRFRPLKRAHPIFKAFYKGLPDSTKLPAEVREFVTKEKWPEGTYSFVGLKVKGRIAVLCTPIIAMGWGKNQLGRWSSTIGFRIRESAKDLDLRLKTAAHDGKPFMTKREDGEKDLVFCQPATKPAWVKEPNDVWRVFRYYHSTEISEFAHEFYTQLGTNIVIYSLTQ